MQRILTKREKIILFITLAVIISSFVFRFLIEPVLNRNAKLNDEINVTKRKLKKYLSLISQKEFLENKYREFVIMPGTETDKGDTFLNILSELERLAKTSNINIIDIRPLRPKTANLYKETLVELRTEGAMQDYFRFIYNIDTSVLLLNIKELRLNAKSSTGALEGTFFISQISLD